MSKYLNEFKLEVVKYYNFVINDEIAMNIRSFDFTI